MPATTKAFRKWWDEQDEEQTCTTCGKQGPKHYVQPQHPKHTGGPEGTACCSDCYNAAVFARRARRKAELDAMPRCEVPGCKHRGNYRSAGTLICGRHMKRAQRAHAKNMQGAGWLALFERPQMTREALLALAQK